MKSRATSFATYQDLVGYIKCLQAGNSSTYCYNKGDNGVGAWGDVTAQLSRPMVALSGATIRAKWGTAKAGRNKIVVVTLSKGHKNPFECSVNDLGPSGIIDLNPAALVAGGLPADAELSCNATWEWK